jgi:hypothetical protein
MATRLIINGQSFGGWDDMPPDLRQKCEGLLGGLEDKDGNGVPDIFEHGGQSLVRFDASSEIIINGRRYASVDAMTPEDRRLYDQMQAAFAEQGWGHPSGLLASAPALAGESRPKDWQPPARNEPAFLQQGRSSGVGILFAVLMVLGGVLIGLAIALGAWLAFK